MIRQLNIGVRLAVIFLLLIVSTVAVGCVSINHFGEVENDVLQMTEGSLVELEGAIELKASLYRTQLAVEEVLLEKYRIIVEPEEAEDAEEEIAESKEEIAKALRDFEQKFTVVHESTKQAATLARDSGQPKDKEEEEEELERLATIENDFNDYKKNIADYLELVEKQPDNADEFLEEVLELQFRETLIPLIKSYRAEEGEEIEKEGEDVFSSLQTASTTVMTLVAGVSILSIVFVLLVSNSILSPVNNLTNVSRSIFGGDLNKRANTNGSDEISLLARVFNDMADKIQNNDKQMKQQLELRTKELVDAKGGLEKQVAERTRELVLAKADLEKQVAERTRELQMTLDKTNLVNESLVGRELKMVDLKNKIVSLEAELKKLRSSQLTV